MASDINLKLWIPFLPCRPWHVAFSLSLFVIMYLKTKRLWPHQYPIIQSSSGPPLSKMFPMFCQNLLVPCQKLSNHEQSAMSSLSSYPRLYFWPVGHVLLFTSCPLVGSLERGQIVSLTPTSLIPLKPEFRWGEEGVGQNRDYKS